MSDFFENLAARSIGAATALRPRLPSHYEARQGDGLEVLEEVAPAAAAPATVRDPMRMRDANADAPIAPAARPTSIEPIAPPWRIAPPERIIVRDVVLATAETRPEDEEHLPEQAGAASHESVLPSVNRETQTSVTPPTHRASHPTRSLDFARDDSAEQEGAIASSEPETHEPPAPESPPRRSERERVRFIRERAIAQARPTPPVPSPRERTMLRVREQLAAEPAVVHVTIGRVEVRAVQPQPPAPRPAPTPAPPGPTLEEFLEQRERRT